MFTLNKILCLICYMSRYIRFYRKRNVTGHYKCDKRDTNVTQTGHKRNI